jgi:glucokinase
MMAAPEATFAIGLDIGGTKIAGGIVDLVGGHVLERRVIMTQPERGDEAVLDDALALTRALRDSAANQEIRVRGVGVGLCELVDPEGRVISAQSFDWRGLPVGERFAKIVEPAVLESDARAPALAEALYGAGRPYRIFAYITVGTGISYALVQDGKPFPGARGNALVFASMPLTTRCTECGALLNPVLEEIASGPALVEHYRRQTGQVVHGAEAVLAAVERGDSNAAEIVAWAGDALGNSAGFLVNVLDPEAIIVGGGLGLAGGLYWQRFVQSTREHIYADNARNLPILPAALGIDAGLIGAAASIIPAVERARRP